MCFSAFLSPILRALLVKKPYFFVNVWRRFTDCVPCVQISGLEADIAANPYNYNPHTQLIAILRKEYNTYTQIDDFLTQEGPQI